MCIVYDTRDYLQKLVGKLREILQLRHFVVVSLCLHVPIGIVKAPDLDYHDHSLQSGLLILTGEQIAGACIFLVLLLISLLPSIQIIADVLAEGQVL